jgi:hypothetical protein
MRSINLGTNVSRRIVLHVNTRVPDSYIVICDRSLRQSGNVSRNGQINLMLRHHTGTGVCRREGPVCRRLATELSIMNLHLAHCAIKHFIFPCSTSML